MAVEGDIESALSVVSKEAACAKSDGEDEFEGLVDDAGFLVDKYGFDWMKTPSHVILIVVTMLLATL